MKPPKPNRTLLPAAGLLGVLLLCPACARGPVLYPVQGQVLVAGKPAEGALVVFHPAAGGDAKALRPSGTVQADGSFTLQCYDPQLCPTPRAGAPAGEYRVSVNWVSPDYHKYRNLLPDKLHGRYIDPQKSGLKAVVNEGTNQLPPFELK